MEAVNSCTAKDLVIPENGLYQTEVKVNEKAEVGKWENANADPDIPHPPTITTQLFASHLALF